MAKAGVVQRPNEPRADAQALRELVQKLDPDVLAAVDDVDRSLIHLALDRRPLERVEFADQMMATLSRFRRVGPARL